MDRTTYIKSLRRKIAESSSHELPPPWKGIKLVSVGGLTDIGFAEDGDWLLTVEPPVTKEGEAARMARRGPVAHYRIPRRTGRC